MAKTNFLQNHLPLALAVFMLAAGAMTLAVIILLNLRESDDCLSQASACERRAAELLALADASLAPSILEANACLACHNLPELAPPLNLAGPFAALRRPPLSAAAYLYEALVYPNSFVIEGYQPTMPITALEDDELGALLAYLLGEGN